jgi:hypothetical protein
MHLAALRAGSAAAKITPAPRASQACWCATICVEEGSARASRARQTLVAEARRRLAMSETGRVAHGFRPAAAKGGGRGCWR